MLVGRKDIIIIQLLALVPQECYFILFAISKDKNPSPATKWEYNPAGT